MRRHVHRARARSIIAFVCVAAFVVVVAIANPRDAAVAARRQNRTVRVQVLVFNPVLHDQSTGTLADHFGWSDPDTLTAGVMADLATASNGSATYTVADHRVIDEWPVLADGYAYNETSWFTCWNDRGTCHNPWLVDYLRILRDHQSCELRDRGVIDEVWVWGGPFFGYWESTLAGPGAFWFNSPPTLGSSCGALLPIMGFNYERGVPEALHSYGHRIESTMDFVYGYAPGSPWRQFSAYDSSSPGRAGCGNVHFPPNGVADYDYGNPAIVQSDCEDWAAWPAPPGNFQSVSCATWGCEHGGYLRWWMSHIPHAKGRTGRLQNNWWDYILIQTRDTRIAWERLLR